MRVVAAVDEDLLGLVGETDGDFLWGEGLINRVHNKIENLDKVGFAQWPEQTNFVEAV